MTTTTTIPEPTTTDTREGRGLALYRERGDEIKHVRGSIWSVPSCTRPGVYLVDLRAGICTCGDMPPAGLGAPASIMGRSFQSTWLRPFSLCPAPMLQGLSYVH